METNQTENLEEAPQNVPPTRTNKGKEHALPDHIDPLVDHELSSNSSSLPCHSPPQSNVEAKSKKRPPRHSNWAINGTHHQMRREASKDRPHSELAPEHMPTRFGGVAPHFLPMQYSFGATPTLHTASYPPSRGPYDMLSSPLGQHILDYKPPCGFVISPFAMYEGSSNPYDHMLHFNQAMILNAGNDRLLCKVFPTSLKGPALAWFHKFPKRSLNSFANCGLHLSLSICALFGRKETSARSNPSSSGTTNPSGISPGDLDKLSNKLMFIVWMRSYRTAEEALGRLPFFSNSFPLIHQQPWKNCISGQTNTPLWRRISRPLHKQ